MLSAKLNLFPHSATTAHLARIACLQHKIWAHLMSHPQPSKLSMQPSDTRARFVREVTWLQHRASWPRRACLIHSHSVSLGCLRQVECSTTSLAVLWAAWAHPCLLHPATLVQAVVCPVKLKQVPLPSTRLEHSRLPTCPSRCLPTTDCPSLSLPPPLTLD